MGSGMCIGDSYADSIKPPPRAPTGGSPPWPPVLRFGAPTKGTDSRRREGADASNPVLCADSKAATEGADASTPALHVDCKAATEGADASTPALHVDSKAVGPAPRISSPTLRIPPDVRHACGRRFLPERHIDVNEFHHSGGQLRCDITSLSLA